VFIIILKISKGTSYDNNEKVARKKVGLELLLERRGQSCTVVAPFCFLPPINFFRSDGYHCSIQLKMLHSIDRLKRKEQSTLTNQK
jgi:hypothetical protein